eukprot:gene6159-12470_t
MESERSDVRVAARLFVSLGIGYLFPFSALSQPVDYWHKLFPDFNIEFPLTSTFMWTNLIVLGLLVFFGGTPSYNLRIVGGFIGQFFVLIMVPTSYFMNLSEEYNFYLIMSLTAFVAISTALIDSSAISFASRYPLEVQESFQLGIGLSAFIGSIYRMLTKLFFPPDKVVLSSLLYFYVGSCTILACIVAYFVIINLPISKRCLYQAKKPESIKSTTVPVTLAPPIVSSFRSPSFYKRRSNGDDVSSSGSLVELGGMGVDMGMGIGMGGVTERKDLATESDTRGNDGVNDFDGDHGGDAHMVLFKRVNSSGGLSQYGAINGSYERLPSSSDMSKLVSFAQPVTVPSKIDVFKKVYLNELWVFLNFLCSLLLWPSFVTEIKSFNFPILQSRVFVSRAVDQTQHMDTRTAPVHIYPTATVFRKSYFGSLAIVMVPECVDTPLEASIAGTFTGFVLNSGLVLGSTIALWLKTVV